MRTVGGRLGTNICRLLSAPAVAGQPAAAAAAGWARLERAHERLHEPGVDGDPVERGRRVEPVLQALRQPEGDAGRERLVGGLGRDGGLVGDEDELRVAAGEADL